MKMRTFLLPFALAVGVPTMTTAAHAADPKHAEAEALHRTGLAQMEKRKFAEAAASFRASYAKDQSPRELYNAARAELAQGHFAEAAKLYRTYLSLPANEKMAPSERAEAKQELADITKNLTTLDVRAPAFTVDGGAAEGLVDVEPGTHSVAMRGPEGPKTKVVVCAKGAVVLVEYAEPAKVVPVVPKTIDPPPSERSEKGSWVVPGVLAALGAVGLGVGVGLQVSATGARDDARTLQQPGTCVDRASPSCTALQDALDSASGQRTGATIALVGGGALMGAAVVSALILRPWETRFVHEGYMLPLVGPGVGGAAVGGRF